MAVADDGPPCTAARGSLMGESYTPELIRQLKAAGCSLVRRGKGDRALVIVPAAGIGAHSAEHMRDTAGAVSRGAA